MTFTSAWKKACLAARCPGRIPHDLRRTAVLALTTSTGVVESSSEGRWPSRLAVTIALFYLTTLLKSSAVVTTNRLNFE
jgi:hypothetical protein